MHALIDPQEKYKTDTPSGCFRVGGGKGGCHPYTIYSGQPRATD
jgi:hypothetical protein